MEQDKDALIDQQAETNKNLSETNNELKEEIALLKAAGVRARKSRRYSIRKYKDHPCHSDGGKVQKRACLKSATSDAMGIIRGSCVF